jgi:hypothetical protein
MKNNDNVVELICDETNDKSDHIKVDHSQDEDKVNKKIIVWLAGEKLELFVQDEVVSAVDVVSFFLVFCIALIFSLAWRLKLLIHLLNNYFLAKLS